MTETEVEDAVLDWIEAHRDREQVISTYDCAADLKTIAYSRVVNIFGFALRQNLIGWDQRCYYTIQRVPAAEATE